MITIVRAFEVITKAVLELEEFPTDCPDPKVREYLGKVRENLSYLADSLVDMLFKDYGL